MALINCPSCGKPISDKAIKCPHCGFEKHPQTEPSKEEGFSIQKEEVEQQKTGIQNDGYTHKERRKNNSLRYIIAAISVLLVVGVVLFTYVLAEQQKQKELIEQQMQNFKNFCSNDLSAFMLHGRVKKMTEYSGQVSYSYYFSKEGVLTNVTISEGNYRCKITHSDRQLIVHFETPDDPYDWENRYVLDSNGRLTECIYGNVDMAETIKYSTSYNTNNWPISCSLESFGAEGYLQYSRIDKHGNWRECDMSFEECDMSFEEEDVDVALLPIVSRDIEYYPIGDF